MENKVYTIKKTRPGSVIFSLSPLSNSSLKKEIYLTNKRPQMNIPLDWALTVFVDNGLYALFKEGYFTFNNLDDLLQEARNAGVYFGDELDFTPAKEDSISKILNVLKAGKRPEILKAIDNYGKDLVQDVATTNLSSLSMSVVHLLEELWKIQLTLDEK